MQQWLPFRSAARHHYTKRMKRTYEVPETCAATQVVCADFEGGGMPFALESAMSVASRVKWFLDVNRIRYEVVVHRYSEATLDAAEAACIPSHKMAKAVLLEDDDGYVMPILPATRRLDLAKVKRELHRDLHLASEEEAERLFFDCNEGAVPAMGTAYGIPTIIDDGLLGLGDIYFEAGDHIDLIHMDGADFFSLIPDANHADLTCA
jgi:Ala-tRNA(Pro) deacylase